MDFLSSEDKKDFVFNYLEESGVKYRFNEILKNLLKLENKPDNPFDFIREELGDTSTSMEDIRKKEDELETAEREIRRLRNILRGLGVKKFDGPAEQRKN